MPALRKFKMRIDGSIEIEVEALNETYAIAIAARRYPNYISIFILN